MLGDSSTVLATKTTASGGGGGNNGEAAPPSRLLPGSVGGAHESDSEVGHLGSNNNSVEEDKARVGGDEGDRSFGGNRWPRQETLALLKIRSDMDVAFRDASVKGPLWEEVSRKLAELGYNRSAKKCKEKFENVFKYHKRTKDGRSGKQDGKTYRFFDQLEAFENHPPPSLLSPPPPQQPPPIITTIAMPIVNPPPPPVSQVSTVPSTTGISLTTPSNPTVLQSSQDQKNPTNVSSSSFPNFSGDSTSSSTSSDVEIQGRRGRKRKWKDFFESLMKEVVQKQEDMQKKLLEAIEKREHDRMVREESWRMQEMARINREREILAQERSIAAAKDAAVMAFLQKLSEQQNPGANQLQNNPLPQSPAAAAPPPIPQQPQQQQAVTATNAEANLDNKDNGEQAFMSSGSASSSRWPKVEIEALINLRTHLETKYQENGPKGPLWEEISEGMRKLGHNRSAKRCKEKWENINKYFKKVKESNKRRPQDSKTCPYFHQLDALYKEKNATTSVQSKPGNSVPLMVRPEQQWPPPPNQDLVMEDLESDQDQQNNQDDDDKDNDGDGDGDGDGDEDGEAGGYELVANRPNQ